jgi:hypothetical protein
MASHVTRLRIFVTRLQIFVTRLGIPAARLAIRVTRLRNRVTKIPSRLTRREPRNLARSSSTRPPQRSTAESRISFYGREMAERLVAVCGGWEMGEGD